jgi:two-component system chemotaxis response regulator CheB
MINVLIVNDSAQARAYLRRVLTARGDIVVVGEAADGKQAVRMAGLLKPHVVTMDTEMPGMDGFDATCEIMAKSAVPIIMITDGSAPDQADKAFRAMDAGAVALVALPVPGSDQRDRGEAEIVQMVRAMSEVKVVHRRDRRRPPPAKDAKREPVPVRHGSIDLVAIGASTGGPQALQRLLSQLPRGFAAPIVVVQHITPGFQASFARWLGEATGLPVALARDGERLQPGRVLVAPHPHQMGLTVDRRIKLTEEPPENGLRPSAAYLFRSVAKVPGAHPACVLLTGMGQDGAAELLELRTQGAVTIAQNEETSIVYGMPGEAVRLGAADYVLAPKEIGTLLAELANKGAR